MTEPDAQSWLVSHYGEAALDTLQRYVELLVRGTTVQNLIASSTVESVWTRHIVDSAQLALHGAAKRSWCDIGSGAGLPGLVVAIVAPEMKVALIEPRRLRVEFLQHCVAALHLGERVKVVHSKAERYSSATPFSVISARAVANLPRILSSAAHLAGRETVWVLPKGTRAQSEVAEAKRTWHGTFHVEPSVVDANSGIVVATNVAAK